MASDDQRPPRALADHLRRRRAVAEAGHTGDRDAARAGLRDPDPGVRGTAINALARLGAVGEDDLRHAARDADPGVRRRAATVVAALGTQPASPAVTTFPGACAEVLDALLADGTTTVVEVAAWASGERQPTEDGAVVRLAALVADHDDALVREAAVAALGAIGDPAGLPAILAATTDKATVRRRAVLALAPFDGPAVEAALQAALTDRDWQVRQAAEDLLEPT